MRIYLEATKEIYVCTEMSCNFVDRDGISQVFFKLPNGLTLIVDIQTFMYEKLLVPKLLKNGFYRFDESHRHRYVKCIDVE